MNNNKIFSTDSTPTSEACPLSQSQRHNSNNKGQYTLGITLGEGAFAKVKLATHNPTQEKIAIKIINKSNLLKEEKDVIRIKKEISILKKIRHKNIIQLYEIMESKSSLYIVMEYCEGKELYDLIVQKKRLSEKETCKFFQQIINAVEYLHDQGIIHRDLKPENILLDDKMNIKISDFGLSTFYSRGNLLSTPCGTPSYAPPEMLRGEQYNGESSDVWSCGIILYAMLCGKLPFAESQEDLICKKIINKDYVIPDYVPKQAKDLLNLILNVNPKERLTIDQIKRHAWFNFVPAGLRPGLALGKQTPPIDENILLKVLSYGYDINKCRHNLQKNKFDSLTTVYYLLLKQHIKQGGKSVSDLSSDEYLRYIIDLSSQNNLSSMTKGDIPPKIEEAAEDNSPCQKKMEGKILAKFHSNFTLPTTATNSNMKNNNTHTFKESFVSSFISSKKQKRSKPKQYLPQPQTKPESTISSNVSSAATATLFSSDIINKQLHLAKHALYKKKRQELTKLKKSQGSTNEIKQQETECSSNINSGLSCINPQLNPIDDNDEDLLFEEELDNIDSMSKNVNILQYIAQKLIGNPFYGSFDISMAQKNQLENNIKTKEELKDDNEMNNYLSNSDFDFDLMLKDEIEKIDDEFLKGNINYNCISKIKSNLNSRKPQEIETTKHKKSIKHSFIKKQEVFIYDYSEKTINNTNDHKNKFLDISTTQLGNSIERSISVHKDLRRYSLSPDKNINMNNYNEAIALKNSNNNIINNQLRKCKKGFREKKISNNELTNIDSGYISVNTNNENKGTLTAGNCSKKYTIHLTKPNQSTCKGIIMQMNSNNNNTHSTDNLFKALSNYSDIRDKQAVISSTQVTNIKSHQLHNKTNSNHSKTNHTTKLRNPTTTHPKTEITNREKLIPHLKKNYDVIEISFEKSIRHTRTGSANESLLKKNLLENKIKINLNEINDTKAFNSICFNEAKNVNDEIIKTYQGPVDLMCCCTMPPKLLYTYLYNLFKSDKVSCIKASLTQLKCSKSLLSFECEVMLLNSNKNHNQSQISYVKFRFKQGECVVYRKLLTSIGQRLQALE